MRRVKVLDGQLALLGLSVIFDETNPPVGETNPPVGETNPRFLELLHPQRPYDPPLSAVEVEQLHRGWRPPRWRWVRPNGKHYEERPTRRKVASGVAQGPRTEAGVHYPVGHGAQVSQGSTPTLAVPARRKIASGASLTDARHRPVVARDVRKDAELLEAPSDDGDHHDDVQDGFDLGVHRDDFIDDVEQHAHDDEQDYQAQHRPRLSRARAEQALWQFTRALRMLHGDADNVRVGIVHADPWTDAARALREVDRLVTAALAEP